MGHNQPSEKTVTPIKTLINVCFDSTIFFLVIILLYIFSLPHYFIKKIKIQFIRINRNLKLETADRS